MMGDGEGFEPEIIGFVCASSGFWKSDSIRGRPGKRNDLRMEVYPVDCVGVIPTSQLQEPLEMGVDGVLIATCGEGLCHYFKGEEKLETRLDTVRIMVEDLGIEADRIVLRKVSDRDWQRFDEGLEELLEIVKAIGPNPFKPSEEPMIPKGISVWPECPTPGGGPIPGVEDYARRTGVVQCLECGKCTASCPVSSFKADFSPMYLIEKALRAPKPEVDRTADYWTCLTCANCSNRCPSNVDFVDFVRFLREGVDVQGGICTHGGALQSVWRNQAKGGDDQARLSWVTDDLKISKDDGEILYFTGCLPYFDVLFDKIGFRGSADIAARTVGILNKAGITPAVLSNEACCGHDPYYTGDTELFKALAERNTAAIRATGARTVVSTCPECYHMLSDIYPKVVDLGVEVKHVSELLAELIDQGKIQLPEKATETWPITYHDPCRLVRFGKVHDAPRKVLKAIPNLDLVEMERNKELSTCCGTSAWTNCDSISERVRADRLQEAQRTGARHVVTSCPKCQIHFKCTQSAKPEERDLDPNIRVVDLVTILSEFIGGGGK